MIHVDREALAERGNEAREAFAERGDEPASL